MSSFTLMHTHLSVKPVQLFTKDRFISPGITNSLLSCCMSSTGLQPFSSPNQYFNQYPQWSSLAEGFHFIQSTDSTFSISSSWCLQCGWDKRLQTHWTSLDHNWTHNWSTHLCASVCMCENSKDKTIK